MNLEHKSPIVSNEMFVKIIESMPYGVIIADNKGMFILWNEKASTITNNTLKALEQQSWSEYFGVYNLDKTTLYKTEDLPMSRSLKGENVSNEKIYIRNKDMQEGVYIKVSSFPIIENNEVIAAVSMFDDITKEQILYETVIKKINDLEGYLKQVVQNTIHEKLNLISNEHTNQKLDRT